MGLIKTAMLSGVAIYGVKQLSHAAERRTASAPAAQRHDYQQSDRDMPYEPAPYQRRPQLYDNTNYHPPPQRQQQRMVSDQPAHAYANYNDSKQPAYDQREYAYTPEGTNQGYPGQSSRQQASSSQYQQAPPEYGQQPPRYSRGRGFVEAEDQYDSQPMASSSGGETKDASFQQAANFMQSRGGDENQGGKGSNVKELLSGFMQK